MAVETRSQRRKRLAQLVVRKPPSAVAPLETTGTCAICLGRLHFWSCHRTSCGHEFHRACLQQWLQLAETCPLCRGHVDPPTAAWRKVVPLMGVLLGWWLC